MGLKPPIVKAGGICSFLTNNYVSLEFDFIYIYIVRNTWSEHLQYHELKLGILQSKFTP